MKTYQKLLIGVGIVGLSFYGGYRTGHVVGFKKGFDTVAEETRAHTRYVWNYLIRKKNYAERSANSLSENAPDLAHDYTIESCVLREAWSDITSNSDRLNNRLFNWKEFYNKNE